MVRLDRLNSETGFKLKFEYKNSSSETFENSVSVILNPKLVPHHKMVIMLEHGVDYFKSRFGGQRSPSWQKTSSWSDYLEWFVRSELKNPSITRGEV